MIIRKLKTLFSGKALLLTTTALVATVVVVGGTTLLTPGSGVTGVVFTRGSFTESTDIKFKVGDRKRDVIHVPRAQETVVQRIDIEPGGHTGWHSHPGPVVVVIKSGTMSFYDGDDPTCTVKTYSAGDAFIDSGQGHSHIARNETGATLELYATYFDVPVGGAFRLDAEDPGYCQF